MFFWHGKKLGNLIKIKAGFYYIIEFSIFLMNHL